MSTYSKNGDNVMFNIAMSQNPGTLGAETVG